MDLQQGSCIRLGPVAIDGLAPGAGEPSPHAAGPVGREQPQGEQLYQVIGIDQRGNRCWLRRWPLARHGSPVFEVPLHQLKTNQPQARGYHRPSAGIRGEV